MAYRFTSTEKWRDSWFSKLKPLEKLLFLYLCDSCDIAGFIEVNTKIWAAELNCREQDVKGALKGLARGLVFSDDMECIFVKNFIKHQKNLPINENNTVHRGILKRLNEYAERFNTQDINDFIENKIEGALKGLDSPIGLGKGNSNGNIFFEYNKEYSNILREWFEYKKGRKQDYKDENSKKKFYTKLYNLSDGNAEKAQKIIDQSMANNWAGIFELRQTKKQDNSMFV
jgi:hypothetical protein